MRLSLAILSTLALSVLANKHRLCCCTGRNRRDTETICRSDLSQKVVDEGGERYVKSFRPWNKKDNPEMPLKGAWDQEPGMGYFYADPLKDDGWLGGDEISDKCHKFKAGSRCWSPRNNGDWQNVLV